MALEMHKFCELVWNMLKIKQLRDYRERLYLIQLTI